MRGKRRWGLLAIAVSVIALAVAIPVAGSAGASEAGNLTRARAEATTLLGLLHVPPGAVELTSDPEKGNHPVLGAPGYDEATPNLVDAHHWWTVRGKATRVLAYVAARMPHGAKRDISGWGGPRPVYYMKSFSLSPVPGVLSERVLAVSVVQLTSAVTAIRTDGEAVWIVPRPVGEKVPADVHEIDITSSDLSRAVSVVGPPVKQIVVWINALGVGQPGTINCPVLGGPTVTFVFRDADRKSVARASGMDFDGTSGECNPISFRLHGRPQPPLIGGNFYTRVQRLIGVRFNGSSISANHVTVLDLLRANGIGDVRFGASPSVVRRKLDLLLGQPGDSYEAGGTCGLRYQATWWDDWTASGEPSLTAYFAHGAFVGYQFGNLPGPSILRVQSGGWSLATIRGLRVGDTLAQGRRLYGLAFEISTAQGGSWKLRVGDGLLKGYTSAVPGHGLVSRVATVDAGDVGCPADSP